MSPLDHLPGGLTQLALVVVAAWAYPRVRAGARAALALLFGFFGVLAGIEAVYYTFADRPSGDDFTGFLSLVAGFVLLGIGIRTLWQSRRTDDSRRRRYLRRGLVFAGVVVLIPTFLMPVSIGYFATHILRAVVPTPNLGAAHEDVSFTTSDGLRLRGLVHPLEQRRHRDRLPRPLRPAEAHAHAREARLRRPPLRPPRRGRERGRSEHVRLGRRPRPARRDRRTSEPPRRRPRPDRRDRLLGRRRDADPRRGALGRVQGGRLRGRERPVDPGRHRERRSRRGDPVRRRDQPRRPRSSRAPCRPRA